MRRVFLSLNGCHYLNWHRAIWIRSRNLGTTSRLLQLQSQYVSGLPEPKYPSSQSDVNLNDLEKIALELYFAGIKEVSSTAMLKRTLTFDKEKSILKTELCDYPIERNVHVVAFGKAVVGMMRSIEDLLSDHIVNALAFLPRECLDGLKQSGREYLLPKPNSKFKIVEGSNFNIPDKRSKHAGECIAELARSLTSNDILICLLSGGGSSLVALPKYPVTLEEKATLTRLLQDAGCSTLELNTVRKNLSLLKAGGLAEMAAPAKVISLILSNLPHDKATEVASGPTAPDYSTPHQALDIFRKYKIKSQVPSNIMEMLETEDEDAFGMKWLTDSVGFSDVYSGPKPRYNASNAANILVGSDKMAVAAIVDQCSKYNIPAYSVLQTIKNPTSRSLGHLFAAVAQYASAIITRSSRSHKDTEVVQCELECVKAGLMKQQLKMIAKVAEEACHMRKPVCLVFSSVIYVDLKGSGIGGPCQEVALATAIELKARHDKHECLQKCDVQLFSIDSDGMDGSTPIAGAIANCHQAGDSVDGKKASYYLDNNDSYTFYSKLEKGRYQVLTGLTGTDIQNFQLLLIRNKTM